MQRWVAYLTMGLVAGAVAFPLVRPDERDSYPLSTYPMFSYDLGRVSDLDTVVGIDGTGAERRLTPTLIAGGHEVIHAAATVSASIANGDTPALCAEVAARVARDRGRGSLVRIEVVSERYDVIAWWQGDREPRARTVHASCVVTRAAR
jgi:hypothetical protein